MFRFSIRELMLVMLVVGLGLGWWIDRSNNARWRTRAGALEYFVREKGYRVMWDAQEPMVRIFDGHVGKGINTLHHEPNPDVNFRWNRGSQPVMGLDVLPPKVAD